jgi:hypothetical protein
MLTTTLLISLLVSSSIHGTGNGTTIVMNDTIPLFSENLSGIINMETAHIVDGIPDAPPGLAPRYPMEPPKL